MPLQQELRVIARLAAPAVLTQVATMLMGVVDTAMLGHLGTAALDAGAIGNMWIWGTLVLGLGVMLGLDPIVSQAHGARDGARCGLALQRGLVLSLLLTPPLTAFWLFAEPGLVWLGQDPGHARLARDYVWVQIPSIPAFLAYSALRQYLTGRGILRPAMWIAWGANGVNLALNWMLIFGHLGAPRLGVLGAGLATCAARFVMLGALVAVVLLGKLHVEAWPGWSRAAWRLDGLREVLRYGAPTALQVGLESWCFYAGTVLAGVLGAVPQAAHTIVLNLASLSFMVPLGIAIAAGTRVGNLIGERRPEEAQRAAWVGLGLGAGVMTLSAAGFVVLRGVLPALYGAEPAVAAAAAGLLPIAAAFQIFDGTQAVGCGILRGMGESRLSAIYNLVGYWVLGLPLGVWLAFPRGLGINGIWWGLTFGLLVVALQLVHRIARAGPRRSLPLTGGV